MEHVSNETKAKEIAKKLSHPNIDSFGDGDDEFDTRFYHTNKDAALEAMQWKDKQFENAIKEIKANIIEKKDNKEYYETSKESTLNWILRLIDECCTKGE